MAEGATAMAKMFQLQKYPQVILLVFFHTYAHTPTMICLFVCLQLYNHIQQNNIVKIYYSYRTYDGHVPDGYFHITSKEQLDLLSGPAVLYNKKIIVATKEIVSIEPELYMVRIQ